MLFSRCIYVWYFFADIVNIYGDKHILSVIVIVIVKKTIAHLWLAQSHYSDVIMSVMASQTTGVSCLLKRLFRCRSKKTSLLVSGLCGGNASVTGEFPAQRASNAEMVPFDDVIMRQCPDSVHPMPHNQCQSTCYGQGSQPWRVNAASYR